MAEYKQTLQLSGKSAYENLYQVVRRLMQTIIETPNPVEGIDMFQILAPSRLLPSKGEFELRFNEQMRPLLLNLRAHFAKIPLPIFFRIQGSYAVRFYLFCKSWDPVNRAFRVLAGYALDGATRIYSRQQVLSRDLFRFQ